MQREFFKTVNSLGNNPNIIISKPDKGSGVVILNCCDYIGKINKILSDNSKFKCLDSTTENNNTAKIETKLQRQLLELTKKMNHPGVLAKLYVLLALKDQECMDYPKSTKKHTTLPYSLDDCFCSTLNGQIPIVYFSIFFWIYIPPTASKTPLFLLELPVSSTRNLLSSVYLTSAACSP